ncbi:MAG: fructosamine kinase family protein [Marinibacterium sp.]
MTGIVERAATLLGSQVTGMERLHGGDLSRVLRLRLCDGRSIVAKIGGPASVEAGMLRTMRAAGVPAPAVIAVDGEILLLEDLGRDDGPGGAWEDLGGVLATLHRARGDGFGWSSDYAFGPVAIANAPAEDWPAFWAERRLLPFCPHIAPDLARRVETLAARLADHLPARPRVSLLHGDLWTGNILARTGRVRGLIDPACYYGHGEVDLAMLTLFGRPGAGFWSAYGPLESSADRRRPIYQLWPALVHLRLFGDGYRALVESCLKAAG